MKPIRFGVLGCASVAKRLVLPAMQSVSNVELVAVASRTTGKAEAYAAEFGCHSITGYEELIQLPGIDAIYMPLPTGLHLEWAFKALDAGKHLFIEKSLACDLAEAQSIVEKAKASGLLVKENYMFEYHSQQSVVRELIETKVGEVRVFRAHFGFPPLPRDNFRYDAQLGGGALLDAGGYVLKALSVFFPNYNSRVQAATLTLDEERGVDVAGTALVNMKYADKNIPAYIAFGFDHHYQCGIEVWGSHAKLNTNKTFTAGPGFTPSVRLETSSGVDDFELPADNHFKNILTRFVESIYHNDYSSEYQAILRQAALQEELRKVSSQSSM
jgi:NDP-hexose-3-ketoreductase